MMYSLGGSFVHYVWFTSIIALGSFNHPRTTLGSDFIESCLYFLCQNPLSQDQHTLQCTNRVLQPTLTFFFPVLHPIWALFVPALHSTGASSTPVLILMLAQNLPYFLNVDLISRLLAGLPQVLSVLSSLWNIHLVFICVWLPLVRIGLKFYLFLSLGCLQTFFVWSLIAWMNCCSSSSEKCIWISD